MRRALLILGFLVWPGVAAPAGKTVRLHPADGDPIAVATVEFAKDGHYRITWDDTRFGDFFLSMRPFKCLEGPEKLWCRVDYPYRIRRNVAGGDLTDLEYDLLFVWKNRNDYGIDLWNGVYYRLNDQGGTISGRLFEIDMNVLASPPEDGTLRPITADDLDQGDPDSHWLPRLTIE